MSLSSSQIVSLILAIDKLQKHTETNQIQIN